MTNSPSLMFGLISVALSAVAQSANAQPAVDARLAVALDALRPSAFENSWMQARYDMLNPTALKRLVAGGVQLRPFPTDVMDACLKSTNELWAEISAKNATFKKVIDAMQAYRNDQYLWWQVAEYTYDTYMIRARTRG